MRPSPAQGSPVQWFSSAGPPLFVPLQRLHLTTSIPALFSGDSDSLLLEKLFMLTSQGRSEELAVPALVRGPVCVCVAPLMSLPRAVLVCFVMVPVWSPVPEHAADSEPTVWLSFLPRGKHPLSSHFGDNMEGDSPSPHHPAPPPGFPITLRTAGGLLVSTDCLCPGKSDGVPQVLLQTGGKQL